MTKKEPTFTFLRWHFFAALVPIALLAGILIGYFLWGEKLGDAREQADLWQQMAGGATGEPAAAPQATETPTRYDVSEDDDPVLGPEDAPITIIEFSDYECPYCAKWHRETLPQLLEQYGDQIRFIYRDFPGSNHPEAIPAAVAANCAGEQGQYYPYQALLFSGELPLGEEAYQTFASELDLDLEAFESCRADESNAGEVTADRDYALQFGVRSTPTFFINGLAVVGAQPYELFTTIIDQELAGEIP